MCGAWRSPLVSYLTVISPRIDRCRSQKYGYTPRWVSSTVAVAPLPASWWLNLPSRLSGVPEVTVCVMSSPLVKRTLAPAGTSMGVGLNWKVWMVTPCWGCAAALPALSAGTTAATNMLPVDQVPIAVPSVSGSWIHSGPTEVEQQRIGGPSDAADGLRSGGSYLRMKRRDWIQPKATTWIERLPRYVER